MLALALLAVVDFLLPAVSIPVYGWVGLIFLWILAKSAIECLPNPSKKSAPVEIYTPELAWVVDPKTEGVYSLPDGDWSLVRTPYENKPDAYVLFNDYEGTAIALTATKLGAAMDQADHLIKILTPEA